MLYLVGNEVQLGELLAKERGKYEMNEMNEHIEENEENEER